jgi:hypothetical protein
MNRDDFSSAVNQLKQFWNGLSKPEKATWVAVTLGFIVDTIAIVHIVLAIRITQVDYGVISSGTAFGIWLIAGFMYLSFLKAYWEKKRKRFTLDSGDLWKYVESGALVNLKYFDHNNYEVDY